ncbi:hypothetical protein VIGAN_UM088700 [Vigna angularis var. angularis]|uniref:Uncharacterized protein n=1 Tax=Vigna angularis var. angularis TaxID=157739 RepID=A0A0S3TE48_PHAAN|nr:hypothetical protein VIGAN_UM088700 [Vigna angularis var. angularis]
MGCWKEVSRPGAGASRHPSRKNSLILLLVYGTFFGNLGESLFLRCLLWKWIQHFCIEYSFVFLIPKLSQSHCLALVLYFILIPALVCTRFIQLLLH